MLSIPNVHWSKGVRRVCNITHNWGCCTQLRNDRNNAQQFNENKDHVFVGMSTTVVPG